MIFLDLDRGLALHLAMALDVHRQACRASGLALPGPLEDLRARCWATARADTGRQEPPDLPDLVEMLHGPRINRLLTNIADAAAALGISQRAVERLVADGTLPSVQVGGRRLIHVRDLEGYAESLRPASSFRDRLDAKVAAASPPRGAA